MSNYADDHARVVGFMRTPFHQNHGESFKASVRAAEMLVRQMGSTCNQPVHEYLWPLAERFAALSRQLVDASAALPPAGGALVESVIPQQ